MISCATVRRSTTSHRHHKPSERRSTICAQSCVIRLFLANSCMFATFLAGSYLISEHKGEVP